MSVTTAPPRSAISPAAATSQADMPPDCRNASNRPFATYASASAAEPVLRDARTARRTARPRVATARPPRASETTQSVSRPCADAWTTRSPEHRRPVGGRPERLAAHRVVDGADGRAAVDHEPHRDAEVRDAVRVVDGAVERVDDPGPARWRGPARHRPAARRVAAGRVVRPRLLGQDPVGGVALADRAHDQRLGEMVHLGDDVPGGLVVDLLDALVALEQQPAGPLGDLPRERGVGGEPRAPCATADHGPVTGRSPR